MDCTEWLTARNQEELDALIEQHGPRLRVRVAGTWGDVRLEGRELRSVAIDGAQIRGSVLAGGARIGGCLHVSDRARIGGALVVAGARIGISLIIWRAHAVGAVDASGAKIGGVLTYRNGLIRGGIVMPAAMHGARGQAVAQCDGYILWRDRRDCYWAGCRGPFTAKQALRHWNRRDERARVFSAAIHAAKGE
jgi:hypothetical protein